MRGRIESASPSKSGKTLGVKIGGQYYQTKHWELQNMVGQEIECETSQSEYNGTKINWLNEYQTVDLAGPSGNGTSPGMPSPAPQSPDMSRYQPLVSNLAAHLITAGAGPEALSLWFDACRRVLESDGFEDTGIPF